jgi:anti-anti-sigma factor
MEISTVARDPLTYRLSGRLTYKDNEAFSAVIDEMAGQSHARVFMDIAHLDFIDSFGIGLFLVAAEAAARSGNTLVIQRPQGSVSRLFRLAKLDSILHIEGTEAPQQAAHQPGTPARHGLWVSPPADLDDHTVRIELAGRFTFTDHAEFETLVATLGTYAHKEVQLGLSGLDFMDSAGLSMLLIVRDELERLGATLSLHSPQGKVDQLLRLASVDKVLPVIPAAQA